MTITIDDALTDPNLLGGAIGEPASWSTWRVALKGAFAEALDDAELETFTRIAGGRTAPEQRVRELWTIAGRRSGKSKMAAAIATFLAAICDHSGRLSKGEVGYVLILAASRLQARVIRDYIAGFLESSPILKALVSDTTTEEIRLTNGVIIAVHTNNFRTVRGRTLLACLFDEVSFWRDELSSSPDVEVYRAALPALATTNGLLIGISSPYRKTGLLYSKHRQFYGVDDPNVLVLQADTRTFNPTINADIVDQALTEDPEAARAEWGGEFRTDLAAFVSLEALMHCVEPGILERKPNRERIYKGFVDAAGGSGTDSMTLAISHTEGTTRILDVIRERKPPFNPEAVTEEFAELLKRYRITTVVGDRYAGEWPAEQFRNRGINFEHSDRSKSQIYLDFLPLVNSRSVDLLDDPKMLAQLANLERRTTGTGRDSVDHPPGAHDDIANVVAGALSLTPASDVIPAWAAGWHRGNGDLMAEADADPFKDM